MEIIEGFFVLLFVGGMLLGAAFVCELIERIKSKYERKPKPRTAPLKPGETPVDLTRAWADWEKFDEREARREVEKLMDGLGANRGAVVNKAGQKPTVWYLED